MKQLRTGSLVRSADRYAGPVLLYAKSLFRKRKPFGGNVRRAAFLKTAAIGDTVLMSAVVRDFRLSYPDAELIFICGADNASVVKMFMPADKVIIINHKNPVNAARTVKGLGHFDFVLDFGSWPRFDAFLASCFDSAFTAGFNTDYQYRHYCYDTAVKHSQNVHELENYRSLARAAEIRTDSAPHIDFPDIERNSKSVVFHMFSGGRRWYLKEWAEERWLVLAEKLTACGYEITVTGSKSDFERAEKFCAASGAVNAAGCSLTESARLLKSSALVISVNTGIMHLASALGCVVVDICGAVRPERWGAAGENSVSLACAEPYISLGFEEKEGVPMDEISVEAVFDAAWRFIKL
ncbi:glycosyltransferase family 9 protein [Geovibrio thiophilus]|uniref:Glycosyltransferase family 9 protein n=1 Tax=Geovibrio thiophilus TaxID=139438 RepID=A0A3R5XY10_9BACT|nr:glycosyltransferase family 9 protein [Geovibrio thiophilus]QAR33525.1 glycosyltransferase family 9 protein [Geovibrio thiophilus]